MDRTVVIAIIIVVVVLGLPLVAKLAKEDNASQGSAQGQAGKAAALEPPYWNAGNLAGTKWAGKFQGIDATLDLQAGGVAVVVASDSILLRSMGIPNTLSGTWSVDGAKFTLEADIPKLGKKSITGTISGKQILDGKGAPLPISQVQ